MSYGPDLGESYRGTAALADKVLKGAHPADLPVEEPTQFSLCINLKTAKALGLTIPPMFLARADQVIEIIAGSPSRRPKEVRMRIHNIYADENGETHFRDIEVEWTERGPDGTTSKRFPASLQR